MNKGLVKTNHVKIFSSWGTSIVNIFALTHTTIAGMACVITSTK